MNKGEEVDTGEAVASEKTRGWHELLDVNTWSKRSTVLAVTLVEGGYLLGLVLVFFTINPRQHSPLNPTVLFSVFVVLTGIVLWSIVHTQRRAGDFHTPWRIAPCVAWIGIVVMMFCIIYSNLPGGDFANAVHQSAGGRGSSAQLSRNDAFYYTMGTLTTTGAGDLYPVVPEARLVTSVEMLCGIMFVLMAGSVLIPELALGNGIRRDNGEDGEHGEGEG